MAFTSHILDSADDEFYVAPNPIDPSRVVQALLSEGRTDEARAELSRLILEGIDSGPGIAATPEFWNELMMEARGVVDTRR